MKIKSYQQGGITYLPTANRTEAASISGAASSNSSSDSSKVPGFTKELIDIIKENGLDSDVSVFLNKVDNLLRRDPTGENINARTLTSLIRQANLVRGQQQDYEKAMASLEEENAWGEYATDRNGYLYVADNDGNVSKVSANNIKNSNLTPLTNEELLNLRRRDPRLAYESGILDDIAGTVGMESIVDYVNKAIDKLGTTSLSGFSTKQANNIITGIENLVYNSDTDISKLITVGPDGVYKISKETTAADTHVYEALNYLYGILPNTYKNTLRAKAEVEGYDTQSFLLSSLLLNTNRKIQADYDATASKAMGFDTDPLKTKSDATKEGSEQLTQDTLPNLIARGQLQQTTAYISPVAELAGDKEMMAVAAWNAGYLSDANKNHLTRENLEVLLPKVYGLRAADTGQITFGNQQISQSEIYNLVWDGSSQLKRVALPYRIAPDGKTVPDFNLLIEFNKVQRYVTEHPGTPIAQIQTMLSDISPYVEIDQNGNMRIKQEKMGIFLTFAAYASSDSLKIEDSSKRFLKKLSREDGRNLKDEYNNLVQFNSQIPGKKNKKIHSINTAEANDFYYGNVYMPILDPTQGFLMSNDEWISKSTFQNVADKELLGRMVQANTQQNPFITNF